MTWRDSASLQGNRGDVLAREGRSQAHDHQQPEGTQEMNISERGLKHVCSACACKYYDLGRKDARCPKCGGEPILGALPSSGRPVKRPRRTNFGQNT